MSSLNLRNPHFPQFGGSAWVGRGSETDAAARGSADGDARRVAALTLEETWAGAVAVHPEMEQSL